MYWLDELVDVMTPVWSPPFLYAVVDCHRTSNPFLFVESLVNAGVELVQLREKRGDKHGLLRLAKASVGYAHRLTERDNRDRRIIINDYPDICRDAGADGVHLGKDDVDVVAARKMLGSDAIIGLSTHSLEEVAEASTLPVDYLGFGPVFESPTKSGHAPLTGTAQIAQAVSVSQFPVVAIGGIHAQNVDRIYRSGARSVAVISDLLRNRTKLASLLGVYRSAFENNGSLNARELSMGRPGDGLPRKNPSAGQTAGGDRSG